MEELANELLAMVVRQTKAMKIVGLIKGKESKMKSWAAEVVADRSGKFCGNGMRFATKEEAEVYVADLSMRWILVVDTRVVESDDPVNYAMVKTGEDESSRYWKCMSVEEAAKV